ncbi:MAG: cation transporter [Bdellovibrionaceae bacterium]|nr:cation transporter [Pseudobdellovibrionaceae bacterium]
MTSFLNVSEQRQRNFAAISSLLIGTTLMFFKFWAYNLTGSEAIRSDAFESIVNVFTAGFAIFVIYYAAKPADTDHPYGHGKVEYFSAAFEGGLISFAALYIIIEGIRALLGDHKLKNLDSGLNITFAAGVVNLLLGWFLIHMGKKNKSSALRASGHHVISDFVTSAGVVLGLVIVKLTNIFWIDAAVAIFVGLYLAYTGIRLARESIGGLLDAEDINLLKELAEVFQKSMIPGIIQLHHVKIIRSGFYHHIDAHVVLPEFWDVAHVHEKVNEFENKVIKNYHFNGEMNFHMDPCRRVYCKFCNLENCSLRQEEFKEKMQVNISQLRSRDEPKEFLK